MITEKDKQSILNLVKTINLYEKSATDDQQKLKWYRFGAYDALRIVYEQLDATLTNIGKK